MLKEPPMNDEEHVNQSWRIRSGKDTVSAHVSELRRRLPDHK